MPKAVVIGAGPAGTASALALRRVGWEVEVCEAYDASAGLDQGAFLTMAVNGLDALAAIGIDDAVRDLGFVTRRIRFASGTGKDLGSMPLGPSVDGAPRTVLRADLYDALRRRALAEGIPVHHGCRLVGAEAGPDGVTAVFADGTERAADLLVGADGLRSRVRQLIDPGAPAPRPTGLGNVGARAAAVPGLDLAAAAADGDYRMVWGRRCFFGYAVDPGGAVWWFANPPASVCLPAGRPSHAVIERLAALLDADDSPAAAIVRATDGPVLCGEQLELPPVPAWQRDRMVLVGDAAHAVSPSTGQGVSLAWEDAAVLARRLALHADPGTAIAAYASARRARVDRVVKWGKRMGDAKAAGPVARRVRDAMFPLVAALGSRPGAVRRQAWLHGHRVDRLPGAPLAEHAPGGAVR